MSCTKEYKAAHKGKMVVALLFFIFSVESFSQFSITKDTSWQWDPAFHGDIVVWEDNRNGNWDIYGYTLSGQQEIHITQSRSHEEDPAVYQDIIVWEDNRNGNKDIYGMYLYKEEFPITTDPHHQENPAIYKNIVAWQDDRNGNYDIYGLNLSTKEEFPITTDPHHQENPKIHGDTIVWEDHRNGNPDIYGYNLETGQLFQITTNTEYQENPAICNNIVIWEDSRNGNHDIYGYNLETGQEFQITTSPHWEGSAAVSEYAVVWVEETQDSTNIYGYNLALAQKFQVTTDPLFTFSITEYDPQIYGNTVIWIDRRHGNADIYGYSISRQWHFLLLPLVYSVILALILAKTASIVQKKSKFQTRWIFLGVSCGIVAAVLEELYIDAGTVLLLVGTPFLSVICGFVSRNRYAPLFTVFPLFMTAYIADTVRINLEIWFLAIVLFWSGLYTLFGVGSAWIATKEVKPQKPSNFFCPNCKKRIEKTWNICPYCKTNLDYTQLYDDGTQIYS